MEEVQVAMCAHYPTHAHSLIRVFDRPSMGSQGSNVSSGGKVRLWSDCADAWADLNHPCTYMPICNLGWTPALLFFVCFRMLPRRKIKRALGYTVLFGLVCVCLRSLLFIATGRYTVMNNSCIPTLT